MSNTWKLSFDVSYVNNDRNSFTLRIDQGTETSAQTAGGHSLFRKFLIHIDVDRNVETDQLHPTFELTEPQVNPQANQLLTKLNTMLADELASIQELTSFEEGL